MAEPLRFSLVVPEVSEPQYQCFGCRPVNVFNQCWSRYPICRAIDGLTEIQRHAAQQTDDLPIRGIHYLNSPW
jgi:hypothetical protein